MAGRITLLILMTGLFAAAWSSDRPPGRTAAPGGPDQEYQSDSVRETALRRWPITSYERVVDASHGWVPEIVSDKPMESENQQTRPNHREMALVANLLAGNWIAAGRLLSADSDSARTSAAWPRLTKSPSARITSQPKPAGSSQR